MTKRILVTGANKGIGRAIAEAILDEHDDTFVYLGSRDAGRGEAARGEMVEAHADWADRIRVVAIDVSDDASVGAAAESVKADLGGERLFGIVNNAGVGFADHGMGTVLNVNSRGIRRVCETFLPLHAEDGRIVNITSAAGPNFVAKCDDARTEFFLDKAQDLTWEKLEALMDEALALDGDAAFRDAGLGAADSYGLSKAVGNAYTILLARQHPSRKINAVTPGFIATDLAAPFLAKTGKTAQEMGMKTPAEGARAPIHLLFGELEGNGRYYGSDAKRSPMDRYRSPGDPEYTGD